MKRVITILISLSLLLSMATSVYAGGEAGAINSSNYGNTYVIKNDGSLWGWGNEYVGNGNKYKQVEPIKIMEDVRSVSAGTWNTVAVKKDDTLWGFGYSLEGYPTGTNELDPTLLSPTQLAIDNVKTAATSGSYILVLKHDGTLWVCGDMYIGDGTETKANQKDGFKKITDGVVDMHAGGSTVFFIKEDNTLWGYGDNSDAQLANMTTDGDTNTDMELTMMEILDDVTFVTANKEGDLVMAIRLDNSLYAWGDGGLYTEEQGWVENAGSPYKVMDGVKYCASEGENAFIIKTDGSLWAWGYSFQGKSVSNTQAPYKVTDAVSSLTVGERHASIIKTDNSLWVMGGNYRDGLGYDSKEIWYTPLTHLLDNVQDAPAGWAYEEVEKAIGEQLIPDNMQGDYTKPITREEFCILAIRMIEVKSGMDIDTYLAAVGTRIAPAGTFTDCDTKEVRAAKTLGITDGIGDGKFAPDNLLTREQAAKFLTTTALACGRTATLSTPAYADIDTIAGWAQPYTGYVYDINVMKGVGSNKFNPKGSYQRQQAFMTMYRIWQAIDAVDTDNVVLPETD